jgi:glycosyltransferase involved in cell wall biosynthesis
LEEEYVQEFLYSHPCAPEAVARTVAAGLGGGLYYLWPMVRVPLEAARLVAVHNRWLAAHLSELYPDSPVTTIRMGVPDPLPLASKPPAEIRRRHRIPEDALLCVAVGQVTAEKGLTRVLMALSTMERSVAPVHLLCVGASGSDFDLLARARDVGAGDRVHLTGYVPDDALPSYLAAADLCLCLRWPTSRETSASWLRCVAAGRPTVITNLLHTIDLPTIDLRTMTVFPDPAADPIAIGVDLVDDLDMLRVTFRRIGADTALRRRIGEAARRYWESNASLEVMVADYADALERARSLQPRDPGVGRPAHLSANGTEKARRLVEAAGLADAARSRLDEVFDRAPRHEATADGERP